MTKIPIMPRCTIAGMVFGGSPELPPLPAHPRQGRAQLRRQGRDLHAHERRWRPPQCLRHRGAAEHAQSGGRLPRRTGKALKDGFTADEVEKAKKTWLDER